MLRLQELDEASSATRPASRTCPEAGRSSRRSATSSSARHEPDLDRDRPARQERSEQDRDQLRHQRRSRSRSESRRKVIAASRTISTCRPGVPTTSTRSTSSTSSWTAATSRRRNNNNNAYFQQSELQQPDAVRRSHLEPLRSAACAWALIDRDVMKSRLLWRRSSSARSVSSPEARRLLLVPTHPRSHELQRRLYRGRQAMTGEASATVTPTDASPASTVANDPTTSHAPRKHAPSGRGEPVIEGTV